MARTLGSVAAVLTAALIVGGSLSASLAGAGCAMSSRADLTPDIDPNLPGIDPGHAPLPVTGQPDKDADSSGGDPDAGTHKPLGAADAAVDTAPPPPTAPSPALGEVFISEVMYATSTPEPESEWIELHSVATSDRSLAGLVLKDGGQRTHVIAGPLKIAPNAWVVLARSKAGAIAARVPPGAIVYEYGAGLSNSAGILLANGATGGIALLNGTTVISAAPYGGWFTSSGRSVQLKVLDALQGPVKASWCQSLASWSVGSDRGSPGSACDCQ